MNNHIPEINIVRVVAERYLDDIVGIEHVEKGKSTFVYRIVTKVQTYYLRFLPEDASFAAEVLVHNILNTVGVKVPHVIAFEHENELTGLSVMLIDEIPGISIEDEVPQANLQEILREAGRQLALIHNVSVDGFGWVDRGSYDKLKGEKPSFDEYFSEYIHDDLKALNEYPFSDEEITKIVELIAEAKKLLDVPNAVLVHGDFDISHIFHFEGRYSGIIDFGEIRGNNRLFDLATFIMSGQDRTLYENLIEGYKEVASLTDNDLYSVELMAMFILLRFLGKKVDTISHEYWYGLMRKQLDYICEEYRCNVPWGQFKSQLNLVK